jgi:uncharacterized protein YegL
MKYTKKIVLFLILFPVFHVKASSSVTHQSTDQTVSALNTIIAFLNTETQRSLLFASYLYSYNREVERYKASSLKSDYGPSYFSSHKNYIFPENEYNLAVESLQKIPKPFKAIYKIHLDNINQLLTRKVILIKQIHNYAQFKNYEADDFLVYEKTKVELIDIINNYQNEVIEFYADIQRLYNKLYDCNAVPTNLAIFQRKIMQQISLNNKLTRNISWIYNDSLTYFYLIKGRNLELKDSIVFFNSYLPVLNSKILSQKFKTLYNSDNEWFKLYSSYNKIKIDEAESLEVQTRILLLYNDIINQYNTLCTQLETNYPLEFNQALLNEIELPATYIDKDQVSNNKSYPINQIILLIDASLSMESKQGLPLFKQNLIKLLPQLKENDEISIVTFSGKPRIVLPLTPISDKLSIITTLNELKITNTSNFEEGIDLCYKELNSKKAKTNANQRIILISDGIFTFDKKLYNKIDKQVEKGIKLSVFYIGQTENISNKELYKLTQRGLGNFQIISNENIKLSLIAEFTGQ